MTPLTIQLDIMGVWRLCLFLATFAGFCSLLRMARKHVQPVAVAAIGWACLRGLYAIEYPTIQYGDYSTAFSAVAGQAILELLILSCFCFYYGEKLRILLSIFITIEIAMVWIFGCGFMMQTSFDSATIALFMPYLTVWLWPVALVTVLSHHGSTALLIIAAHGLFMVMRFWSVKWVRLGFGFLMGVLISAAAFHNSDALLNGGERLEVWHRYMTWWWEQGWPARLFGTGLGSFTWFNFMIDGYQEPHFVQMHNDWLQITFELGLFGVGLVGATFAAAATWMWRKDETSVCAMFGLAAFMTTYHPFRFAPTMVIIGFIGYRLLKAKKA